MTPLDLLDSLKAYIQQETKDIILPTKTDRNSGEKKERAPEIYIMRLPDVKAEINRVPYLLLQYIKGVDSQQQGQYTKSTCMVRIVAVTYSEDGEMGGRGVLNLLTRIRIALLRDGIIEDRYIVKSPIETLLYPDSTPPYYIGEMMTEWQIPALESEVQKIWQ